MNNAYVIDANVLVAVLRPSEPYYLYSRACLYNLITRQASLFCPTLALPEIAAAIVRGTGDEVLARSSIATLYRLDKIMFTPLDEPLANLAAEVAIICRLHGADAVYVAVARQVGATLLTWDTELLTRATRVITTLMPDKL
ncbi:MAG: type II toxin-antitoxin system VapC family toxin [Anaerolineae bacterium]